MITKLIPRSIDYKRLCLYRGNVEIDAIASFVHHKVNAFDRMKQSNINKVQIVRKIIEVLSNIKLLKCRSDNTKIIKSELCKIGLKLGYDIEGNGFSKVFAEEHKLINVEWLYDQMWFKQERPYKILRLVLAAEIEWDGRRRLKTGSLDKDKYGAVKYDFQKLITSTSDIQVMVFKERHNESFERVVQDYFLPQIKDYKNSTEGTYILLFAFCRKNFKYVLFHKIKSEVKSIMRYPQLS